jgi:Rho GTPase-activating protein 1
MTFSTSEKNNKKTKNKKQNRLLFLIFAKMENQNQPFFSLTSSTDNVRGRRRGRGRGARGRGRGRARRANYRSSMTVVELQGRKQVAQDGRRRSPGEYGGLAEVFGEAPAPPPAASTAKSGSFLSQRKHSATLSDGDKKSLTSTSSVGDINPKRSGRRFEGHAKVYDQLALQTLLEAEARSDGVALEKDDDGDDDDNDRDGYGGGENRRVGSADDAMMMTMRPPSVMAPLPPPARAASSSSAAAPPLQQSKAEADYERYLMLSRSEDFSAIEPLNIIYQSGVDRQGRPVVVIVAQNVPAKKINMDSLLLYVIKVMDDIVERHYALVFCNTNMSASNRPNFAWLRKVYAIFNRKYKKNLKAMYIVHPSIWTKMIIRCFKPFISNKFWRKFNYIDDVSDIYEFVDRDVLRLPGAVITHRPRKKPLFGVPLEDVLNSTHSRTGVPFVVEDCAACLLSHLDTVGLFRVSASKSRINEIKHSLDRGEAINFDMFGDPHIVACTLKQFLRELPEPLFTFAHYDSFIATHQMLGMRKSGAPQDAPPPPIEPWIHNVAILVAHLPAANKACLLALFELLERLVEREQHNKMSLTNCAIVFGPTLFRSPNDDMSIAMAHTPIVTSLLRQILTHYRRLFERNIET